MAGPVPVLHNGMSAEQGIWDTDATQRHKIGQRASLDDGRVFYYARNSGAAIVAGNLLITEAITAQFEDLAVNTAQAGDKTVTVTLGTTAVTLNEYEGGYLFVIDDTGEGITYKVASHPEASATTSVVLTLVDPINVNFAAGTTIALMKNPWADVIISATGQGAMAAGISQVAVALGSTDPQFFWCQTWGPSCGWQDEASAINAALTTGTGAAGQLEAQDLAGEPQIAINLFTGTVGENQPVFLRIAP